MDLCIIIPAYNSRETIDITLESIKKQKLSIKFEVIIVNDCSDYNYKEFVDKYKKFYNIRELKTKVNSGPGVARQLGIDNSNSKYIVFIDSDDYFYKEDSLEKMYSKMTENNYDLLIANFIIKTGLIDKRKFKDLSWLHGKMYKREFLEKNNIKFNSSRANEDNGFNRLIIFMKPDAIFLDEFVYVYSNINQNSITRRDNNSYDFYGIEGFCYNMEWAIKEAIARGVNKTKFGNFSLDLLLSLYVYYFKFINKYEVNKIFEWGKYIKEMYDYNKKNISEETYNSMIERKKQKYIWSYPKEEDVSFEDFLDKFEN